MVRTLDLVLVLSASVVVARPTSSVDVDTDLWRHEIARRTRAMETAYAAADEASRVRVVPVVDASVRAFGRGKYAETARALDDACSVLERRAGDDVLWFRSLVLVPERRAVEHGDDDLAIVVQQLYEAGEAPNVVGVRVEAPAVGIGPSAVLVASPSELPQTLHFPVGRLDAGEYDLEVSGFRGSEELGRTTLHLSVVPGLAGRLERLRAAEVDDGVARDTVQECVRRVERLAHGGVLEAAGRANDLLRDAEAVASGAGAAALGRPGERLVVLRGAPTRLVVPDGASADAPVPVVVALHNAVGNEDSFTDGYAAGLTVDLCRRRGWCLVAPRHDGRAFDLAATLDELATFAPIDRERVFVVGHSLGATIAVRAIAAAPRGVVAYAALSGGAEANDALARIPAFLAHGDTDFGSDLVKGLAQDLRARGAEDVDVRVFSSTEHRLIVHRALRDVFAFFDAHAGAESAR
ncbi:MAG: dienelactone hydrolase family protein [Planctomycetota bacterium]